MPVENTNTGFGQGSTGAHTNTVPSHSSMPSRGPANYTAAQLAQSYNAANAASTNPQNVHYSVGPSGNLQISTSPSVASTPSVQATNQSPSANATSTQTVSNLAPSTSASPYMNANTPAAQQYIALAKAYGVPITQQAINNANSPTNPSNFGVYGGYGNAATTGSTTTPVTGSGLPGVTYQTFGSTAKLSFPDPHGSAFEVQVPLPGGSTFTYSGNVAGVPLGTINAQDQAIAQAWSAYQAAQQGLQGVPAGASMTVTQGNNGLNLNINTAAGTSLPTQTVAIAPGLTFTGPTSVATAEAAASLLNSAFMKNLNPSKTYTSDGITFTGSQLQTMYANYEDQIYAALLSANPIVTVGGTTTNFNSLTLAQQTEYTMQQTDQYLQNMQYNGPGYYNINGKNVYITNSSSYGTELGNGVIGTYEGQTAPQAASATSSAPVTVPTFTTASGSPLIELPQGWYTDANGNLYVNGNSVNGQFTGGQAPSLQQSEQYANAYAGYLNWYEANNPNPSTSSTTTATPPVPNWYNTLLTAPTGAVSAANLATFQYAPLASTTAPPTPLQDIESWLGKNIVTPAESAFSNYVAKPLENTGKDIENFWNYYPIANGPGQALGSYSFNTPVQNLKYNVSTKQEWAETNVPGVYINPATHQYWNSNNYEVDGFQPMNSLPPNVATPSSLFNQYVAKPFEQYVAQPVEQAYLSYLSPKASPSPSQPTLSGLQPAGNQIYPLSKYTDSTIAENAPVSLQGLLGAQAGQSPSTTEAILENEIAYNLLNQYLQANINKYSSPSAPGNIYWGTNSAGQPVYEYLNPNLWAARLAQLGLAMPGLMQNFGRGIENLSNAPSEYLFNTHYTNPIPAAPSYETAPAEKFLSTTAPNYISNFINAGVGGANPGEGIPVLKQLANIENVVVPGIANNFPQSLAYLGSPNQTPLGTAYNTLFLGSSALMPTSSYIYGLGSGAINTATNWLFGSPQSTSQAFQSGYKFGAATAPLFEGAQLLGAAASKFLFPMENQYQDVLDIADSLKGATRGEVNAFKEAFIAAHPEASLGEIQQAVEDFIAANSEANSAMLSLDALRAGSPATIAKGLAKLAVRTAPVSTLMGGITSGSQYIAGVRNPTQLAEDFGLGYLGGEAMQTVIPAFLDGILRLKAMAVNLNPDAINLQLRGTPFLDDNGNLYYLFDQHTPNGPMPTRFLLSTTQQVQTAAALEAQINAAADAMKVDPDVVRSALISNYRDGMTPQEFYQAILDSQKGSYISHATPSDFPEGIAKTGETINIPDPSKVGDTLRKLLVDYQGLYSAPSTEFGTPQLYNYLGVRPDLSQNMEQSPLGSNKVGIVTQFMNKEGDYLPFKQFVKSMNDEGADINPNAVSEDTQDFIGRAKELASQKFENPEAKIDAFNKLKDEPKYAKIINLYDKYNQYALLNGYNQIDSVRQALLGSGETEVATPVGYSLRPVFDIMAQKPMSYPFITTEPNVGVFEGTPFRNIIPTTRFGAQTFATAIAPSLTEAEKEAMQSELSNYKYNNAPEPSVESPAAEENNLNREEPITSPEPTTNLKGNQPNIVDRAVNKAIDIKNQLISKVNDLESRILPTAYEKAVANGEIDANGNSVFKYDNLKPSEKASWTKLANWWNGVNAANNVEYGVNLPTDITGREFYDAAVNHYDPNDMFDSQGKVEARIKANSQAMLNEQNYQTELAGKNTQIQDLENLRAIFEKNNPDGMFNSAIDRINAEIAKVESEPVLPNKISLPTESGTTAPESEEQYASSTAYYRNVIDTVTNLLSDVISRSISLPTSPPLSTPYSVSPASASPYSISLSPSVSESVSPSISESVSPSISYSTSPSISESVSPSVSTSPSLSVSPSVSPSLSPSLSPSPSPSPSLSPSPSPSPSPYFYPGSIRKPLDIFPPLKGSQWFAPQQVMAENPYEAYASIYSPSLLPEVMPELESLAEQEYSPMTALSTIRPLRAPSVNTPITLPPYATPTQPTVAEENLPGASNYYQAQSTPMAHIISSPSPTAATKATTPTATATPSYSFNEPFSNAPAATQVAPITDPAILQAISTAANPVSLGTLPANAPPSAYSVIANPMLQSLNRLNMNALRLPTSTLPNQLNSQTMAMSATSPSAAAPAFGFAGYSAPRIGNISLIPTAQDIMSVLGPEQMLRLLNQINPTKFSVTNIQYAPRATLASALNNLSYSDIVLLMSEMSIPQRMMVYGLLGIPPGEALIIAESGTQGLFIPSLSNALAATTRKRIAAPISSTSPSQPAPTPIININPPIPNTNKQLVTV